MVYDFVVGDVGILGVGLFGMDLVQVGVIDVVIGDVDLYIVWVGGVVGDFQMFDWFVGGVCVISVDWYGDFFSKWVNKLVLRKNRLGVGNLF